jgi:hypothetical protein
MALTGEEFDELERIWEHEAEEERIKWRRGGSAVDSDAQWMHKEDCLDSWECWTDARYDPSCCLTLKQKYVLKYIDAFASRLCMGIGGINRSGPTLTRTEFDMARNEIDDAVGELWGDFYNSYYRGQLSILNGLHGVSMQEFGSVALRTLKHLRSLMLKYRGYWTTGYSYDETLDFLETVLNAVYRIEKADPNHQSFRLYRDGDSEHEVGTTDPRKWNILRHIEGVRADLAQRRLATN